MQSVYVSLPTPQRVQAFVEVLSGLEGEFELVSGKYILDAKSLMGIFTLDITKPIQLNIHRPTPPTLAAIAPFMAPQEESHA